MNKVEYIFLITIDCLRADYVGCINNSRDITPNLDKIAKEGIVFTNAISNGPYTRAALPSILTSSYSNAYPDPLRISKYRTSIAEILSEHNFYTAGFNTNPYLSSYFSYDKGFDYFYDILNHDKLNLRLISMKLRRKLALKIEKTRFRKLLEHIPIDYSTNRDVKTINKKVLKLIKNQTTKLFLWMHYMDTHVPYNPPRKYTKLKRSEIKKINNQITDKNTIHSKELRDQARLLYEGSIKDADRNIGKFLNNLKKLKIFNKALFIITSDHGDEFQEHGDFSHPPKLYDELIRIPLIIKGPGLPKNLKIDELVSSLDIAPTIIDYLEYDGCESFMGKSFLSLLLNQKDSTYHRIGVISEIIPTEETKLISYRTKKWKLIINRKTKDKQLYDLENDPSELLNLAEKEPNRVEELSTEIEKYEEKKVKTLKKVYEMKKIDEFLKQDFNFKLIGKKE